MEGCYKSELQKFKNQRLQQSRLALYSCFSLYIQANKNSKIIPFHHDLPPILFLSLLQPSRLDFLLLQNICFIDIFLMKPFFQLKPSFDNYRESLCLPQLRTKSMSIPSTKLHNNYNGYHHRHFLDSPSPNTKLVINLEEIQRKAQSDLVPTKVNIPNERKKLFSQYQTIDLWKQKHHPEFLANYQKRINILKQIPQSDGAKSSLELNIGKSGKKFSQFSAVNSNNNSQIKISKKEEKQMEIPDQFLIKRINAYSKLRKDEKLEMILKRDLNNESNINMRKSYKSSLPVFEKQIPVIKQKRKSDFDNNPSKWQISKQYTEQDQLMQNL